MPIKYGAYGNVNTNEKKQKMVVYVYILHSLHNFSGREKRKNRVPETKRSEKAQSDMAYNHTPSELHML